MLSFCMLHTFYSSCWILFPFFTPDIISGVNQFWCGCRGSQKLSVRRLKKWKEGNGYFFSLWGGGKNFSHLHHWGCLPYIIVFMFVVVFIFEVFFIFFLMPSLFLWSSSFFSLWSFLRVPSFLMLSSYFMTTSFSMSSSFLRSAWSFRTSYFWCLLLF